MGKVAYLCNVIQRNSQKGRQPLWPSGRFEPQNKTSHHSSVVALFLLVLTGTVTQYWTYS